VGMAPSFEGWQNCPMPPTPAGLQGHTVVSDWQLTCGKEHYLAVMSSAFFFGVLLGAPFVGSLSDSHGRKNAMLVSTLFFLVASVATAVSTGPYTFAFARALAGIGVGGMGITAFVLNAEFLGTHRSVLGITTNLSFAVGCMFLSLLAFRSPTWRSQAWACFLLGLPNLAIMKWVPESPKWYACRDDDEQVLAVLAYVAKFNGAPLFEPTYTQESTPEPAPLSAILKHPLNLRAAVMIMAWFSASLCYYGLALNAGSMGSNIYLTNALGAAVETPAYLVVIACIDRPAIGRKMLCVTFFFAAGAACVNTVMLTPGSTAETVTALFGRFAISIVFATLYLWGAELFPTCIRSGALGLQSMSARVAGMVAPFVLTSAPSPLVMLGIPATICGGLCLLMDETVGKKMPDTIEELTGEHVPLVTKKLKE